MLTRAQPCPRTPVQRTHRNGKAFPGSGSGNWQSFLLVRMQILTLCGKKTTTSNHSFPLQDDFNPRLLRCCRGLLPKLSCLLGLYRVNSEFPGCRVPSARASSISVYLAWHFFSISCLFILVSPQAGSQDQVVLDGDLQRDRMGAFPQLSFPHFR